MSEARNVCAIHIRLLMSVSLNMSLRNNFLGYKYLNSDVDPDPEFEIFLTLDPGWKNSYPG